MEKPEFGGEHSMSQPVLVKPQDVSEEELQNLNL